MHDLIGILGCLLAYMILLSGAAYGVHSWKKAERKRHGYDFLIKPPRNPFIPPNYQKRR